MKGERFIIINVHLPILPHDDIPIMVTIMSAIAGTVGWLGTFLTHPTSVAGQFAASTDHCNTLSVKTGWFYREERRESKVRRGSLHDSRTTELLYNLELYILKRFRLSVLCNSSTRFWLFVFHNSYY